MGTFSSAVAVWTRADEEEGRELGRRGYGGRCVAQPYLDRVDVGSIGFMTANWGGARSDAALQRHVERDLKCTPATILLLQEAHGGLDEMLGAEGQASGVQESSGDEGIRGSGDGGPHAHREAAAFHVIRGLEDGSSVAIAGRKTRVVAIEALSWHRNVDTTYKRRNVERTRGQALSRILVGRLVWARAFNGEGAMAVATVHLHHLTAKKEGGTAEAHASFFDKLAALCAEHGVRVIGGDWNMSLFVVAGQLRRRGVPTRLAAWKPWRTPGRTPRRLLRDVPGGPRGRGAGAVGRGGVHPRPRGGGRGFSLTAYLPKSVAGVQAALAESLAVEAPAVAGRRSGRGAVGAAARAVSLEREGVHDANL